MSIFRAFSKRFFITGDGTEIFIKCLKSIPFNELVKNVGQGPELHSIDNSNAFIAKYPDKEQAAEGLDRLKKDSNLIVRFAFKFNR